MEKYKKKIKTVDFEPYPQVRTYESMILEINEEKYINLKNVAILPDEKRISFSSVGHVVQTDGNLSSKCPFCKKSIYLNGIFTTCEYFKKKKWKEAIISVLQDEVEKVSYDYTSRATLLHVSVANKSFVKNPFPYWKVEFELDIEFRSELYKNKLLAIYRSVGTTYSILDNKNWEISWGNQKIPKMSREEGKKLEKEIIPEINEIVNKIEKEIIEKEKSYLAPKITNYEIDWKRFKEDRMIDVFFCLEGYNEKFWLRVIEKENIFNQYTINFYDQETENWQMFKEKPSLSWQDAIFDQVVDILSQTKEYRVKTRVNSFKRNYISNLYEILKNE